MRTEQLDPAERLLVSAWRRWLLGLSENTGAHWSWVWNEFAVRLGPADGRQATAGLAAVVRELQGAAVSRIRYHHPCCPVVAPDELRAVAFIGACQRGEWPLAGALAGDLVAPEAVGALLSAGARLAGALRRHGLHLPHRRLEAPKAWILAEQPATLH